ncbi:MAG: hypothetical protein U1E67_09565 [Hyphomicrobiales bacterium]
MNSLAVIAAPERLLPLAILGIGLGLLGRRRLAICGLVFAAGFVIGVFLPRSEFDRFLLPALFLLAGFSLIGSRRWRELILPPASFFIGMLAGYGLVRPDTGASVEIAGAAITLLVPILLALAAHAFDRPWLAIPTRIGGSWLLAIGSIFAAVLLRPGDVSDPAKLAISAPALPHNDSLPHIHGANGEVIYLAPGRGGGEELVTPARKKGADFLGKPREP